ncbi:MULTISPECIES: VWA domain-containing protein [unclassified Blastococcus]
MLTAVEGLVAELREVGVPVPVSAVVDAARAMTRIDVLDRGAVRVALRAVLIKDAGHLTTYDTVFDTFFALQEPAAEDEDPDRAIDRATAGADDGTDPGTGDGGTGRDGDGHRGPRRGPAGGLRHLDDDALRDLLVRSLREEDAVLLRALARVVVDRHAAVKPDRPQDVGYNLYRALRMIDSNEIVVRLAHAADPQAGGDRVPSEVARLAARAQAQELGRALETEIRRRLVADRGAEDVARTLRTPLPENMAFLGASPRHVAAMREALRPLARSLAARLAQRRRQHQHGALDVRRTLRTAMSTGGVPVTPVFRRPHPAKPQLVVLADISGSVSTFATFTLQLVHALRSEFTSIRSFAFVDTIEEVTDLIDGAADPSEIAHVLNEAGAGVGFNGRSDYGNALAGFAERWAPQLTRRTTVLVLGDARGNDLDPRTEALAVVRRQAGAVHWLNPEPRESWGTGDSDIDRYAAHCDTVVECRTLRDLRAFAERLAGAGASVAPGVQPAVEDARRRRHDHGAGHHHHHHHAH